MPDTQRKPDIGAIVLPGFVATPESAPLDLLALWRDYQQGNSRLTAREARALRDWLRKYGYEPKEEPPYFEPLSQP